MANVKELMTDEVATVDVTLSLRDVLETLRSLDVSGAPVLRGSAIVGVVSATDILEFAATTPGVPTSRSDRGDWTEVGGAEEWSAGDEGPPSFFTDYWSDAGADVTARFDEPESPEWDLLADFTVGEVMTRQIVAVGPDAEVHDAAKVMMDAGVHRLLVTEGDNLVGILTATDLVRGLAERKI